MFALLISACATSDPAPAPVPGSQDIVSLDLRVDLRDLSATSSVEVRVADGQERLVLDANALDLRSIVLDGAAVDADLRDGRIVLPADPGTHTVEASYGIPWTGIEVFQGWMPDYGTTALWPTACGWLYPCDPRPADGLRFGVVIDELPADAPVGSRAVAPADSVGEGPAYQVGFAVGQYERFELGETDAGTTITVHHFPESAEAAATGATHLLTAFQWFEEQLGPYAFGPEYGAVEVDWGEYSWGGIEHHPLAHVATFDIGNAETQVHEAAHGWFGASVRLACWEDYVLSEGTVTWLTARALARVADLDLWPYYTEDLLAPICAGELENTRVHPEGCTVVDPTYDSLGGLAAYMKGACFFAEVGERMGRDEVLAVVAQFYVDHAQEAATLDGMIDRLAEAAGTTLAPTVRRLADEWLHDQACPTDAVARCLAAGTEGTTEFWP